jgi:hypothetical protein
MKNPVKARIGFLVLFLNLSFCQSIQAHPGYQGIFHAHRLEEAKQLASREYRSIFVYVNEDRGKRFKLFRWPELDKSGLLEALTKETVMLELDASLHAADLAAYNIDPPAVLLLDANGTLQARWPGKTNLGRLSRELIAVLYADTALHMARANLQHKGDTDFPARERLAVALAKAGDIQGAAEHYRWCARQSIESASPAAKMRRTALLTNLAQLAKSSEVFRSLLIDVRTESERRLLAVQDPALARDLGRLNARLGDARRNQQLFDQLARGSDARRGLFDYLVEPMAEAGRYEEMLELIDPLAALKGEIKRYQRNTVLRPSSAEQGTGRGTRSFVIKRALAITQALAAQGKDDEALQLLRELQGFDDREETRRSRQQILMRSGRTDLIQRLRKTPRGGN